MRWLTTKRSVPLIISFLVLVAVLARWPATPGGSRPALQPGPPEIAASALQGVGARLEELVAEADHVFMGRVLSTQATPDRGTTATEVVLAAESYLKSRTFQRFFSLLLPDSSVGGLSPNGEGPPQLVPGQRVLLLVKGEGGPASYIVGALQGVYYIDKGEGVQGGTGERLPLEELEARIRQVTLLPAPAYGGALVVRVGLEELTARADRIVTGRVVDLQSRLISTGSSIETDVTISLTGAAKGPAATEVTFTTPGGQVGELRQLEGGVPNFLVGERVFLFLRDVPSYGLRLAELWQGKFSLVGDMAVQPETGERLALQELEGRVGQALSAPGQLRGHGPQGEPYEAPYVAWSNCGWATTALPLPYYVNAANPGTGGPTGTEFIRLAHRSHQAWQDLSTSFIAFRYAGTTTRSGAGSSNDGNNDVRWADLDTYGSGVLGINTCYTSGGLRTDTDTRIDNTGFTWDPDDSNGISAGTYSLQAVLEHELGHALGLDHAGSGDGVTCDGTASTPLMCPSISSGGRKTILADDSSGAAAIYPLSGATPGTPQNLTATPASTNTVGLTWTPVGSDHFAFEVWRGTGSCPGATTAAIQTVQGSATSFTDNNFGDGLTLGTYCYSVRALGTGGQSSFSNNAEASTTVDLSTSTKGVNSPTASPGYVLTYTLTLTNTGSTDASGARLTDTLPLSVTYVVGSASGGATYVTATGAITWTGVVTAGAAIFVSYSAVITSPLDNGSLITNTATINDGVNVPFETGPVTTTVSSAPNLSTSAKAVSSANASPGATITYTVTLSNTGNMNATGRLTDTLPITVTYVPGSATGGASYDTGSRSLTWTGVVTAGSALSLTYSAVITSPLDNGTLITNTATINDGVNPAFETAPVTTTISSSPVLSTSAKGVSSATASPGQTLTYTLTLSNTGNMNASARLTDTLPISVTYVSGSASGGATYVSASRSITWTGVVTAGSALSLTYSAVITSPLDNGTLITNTATINDGVNPAFETAPVTTTISSSPVLSTSAKGASSVTASPGGTITYTLTLTNTGNMNAPTRLTDTLPISLTYVAGSASGGATYNGTSRSITWTGAVTAGSALSLTYSAVITSPLDNGTVITNTATINDGVNPAFETAPVITTISSSPVLSTSAKAVSSATASPGQTLTYTLTLSNTGNMNASTARLTDTLPISLTYIPGSASGGATYVSASRSITWTGVVTAGSAVSLTYSAVITSPLDNGSLITNTATVHDGVNAPFETAPVTTTISSAPNLSASAKTVSAATASPGQVLTYTLTLTNSGDMNATARLTDTLPLSLAYASGSASGGATYDTGSRSLTWTGVVTAGSAVSLTYSAVITSPLDHGTLITNTATINDGVNPAFETAPVTTTVTPTIQRVYIPYLAKNYAAGW